MFVETAVNTTVPMIEPLVSSIQFLIGFLNILLGGIFGIYLIMAFINWKKSRDVVNLLREIRTEIKQINAGLANKKKK